MGGSRSEEAGQRREQARGSMEGRWEKVKGRREQGGSTDITLNGFSPVWTLLCRTKSPLHVKKGAGGWKKKDRGGSRKGTREQSEQREHYYLEWFFSSMDPSVPD